MKTRIGLVLVLAGAAALTLAACASGAKKDAGLGRRVLDCVVVERDQESTGRSGSRSDPSGYYLVFEAQEGAATSRYRFQVTRQQWFRFPEGSRVKITLNNNILQDIRPGD